MCIYKDSCIVGISIWIKCIFFLLCIFASFEYAWISTAVLQIYVVMMKKIRERSSRLFRKIKHSFIRISCLFSPKVGYYVLISASAFKDMSSNTKKRLDARPEHIYRWMPPILEEMYVKFLFHYRRKNIHDEKEGLVSISLSHSDFPQTSKLSLAQGKTLMFNLLCVIVTTCPDSIQLQRKGSLFWWLKNTRQLLELRLPRLTHFAWTNPISGISNCEDAVE